jgi:phage gp45-like
VSATDDDVRTRRDATSPETRRWAGLARRMVAKLTRGPTWQVLGHLLLENNRETVQAENFSGIGFFARPKASHRSEALVIYPGGAANPIIVATRDEDARKAIAELGEDETAAFNSTTIVLIKGNTVEVRLAGGTAAAVAKLADLTALKSAIQGWTPVSGDGGAALKAALTTLFASWPVGTVVFKAQ